jgi:hypothetical protein
MFKEAFAAGTMECYLPLSCHFDARECSAGFAAAVASRHRVGLTRTFRRQRLRRSLFDAVLQKPTPRRVVWAPW